MSRIEFFEKIFTLNDIIETCILTGREIPKDLQLEHNKVMNDYNELIRKEKSNAN